MWHKCIWTSKVEWVEFGKRFRVAKSGVRKILITILLIVNRWRGLRRYCTEIAVCIQYFILVNQSYDSCIFSQLRIRWSRPVHHRHKTEPLGRVKYGQSRVITASHIKDPIWQRERVGKLTGNRRILVSPESTCCCFRLWIRPPASWIPSISTVTNTGSGVSWMLTATW
jgi:hypothetical protein